MTKHRKRIRGGQKQEEESGWDYFKKTWLPRIFDTAITVGKFALGAGHNKQNPKKIIKL